MKVLARVAEVSGEGLESFIGKPIALFCMNYIYSGTLVGVNDTCVKLEDAGIVYETGTLTDSNWKDAQKLSGGVHYVQVAAIESFGAGK